jgi:hypothetical protein
VNDFLHLALMAFVLWLVSSAYAAGKREGSRKGYGVGFDRGRRAAGGWGCLLAALAFGLALAAAAASLACW